MSGHSNRCLLWSSGSLEQPALAPGGAPSNGLAPILGSSVCRQPRAPKSSRAPPIVECIGEPDTQDCSRNDALVGLSPCLGAACPTGRSCKRPFNGTSRSGTDATSALDLLSSDLEACCPSGLLSSFDSYKSLGTDEVGLGTFAWPPVEGVLSSAPVN